MQLANIYTLTGRAKSFGMGILPPTPPNGQRSSQLCAVCNCILHDHVIVDCCMITRLCGLYGYMGVWVLAVCACLYSAVSVGGEFIHILGVNLYALVTAKPCRLAKQITI